jgi:Tfp pilus assembly protein PilF
MLTAKARLIVGVIAGILLGWTLYNRVYEGSAIVALGIILLVWFYFKTGTVVLASKAFNNKDYEKTEQLLKEIKNPDVLSKSRRGFYEFMYGNIELKRNNFQKAETHFQIASRFPLRNENDRGLILVQLANLNLRKPDYVKAKAYIETAKNLKISSRVQSIIQKIEKEIPNQS